MKHKHADLIHAWADGAKIQMFDASKDIWIDCSAPKWVEAYEYRIKPEEKKPVVRWLWATNDGNDTYWVFAEEQPKGFPIKLEWSRTEFPE